MVNPAYLEESAPPLLRRAVRETNGRPAADRLVADYRYLCRRGARKFWRPGLERCDLEQVAAIGLIKASRRFDPSTSTPFEAYAWLIVVGELGHYVRDFERIVRVPRRLRAFEPLFNRASDTCTGRIGREPTDAELAQEMGVLAETVAEIRRARESAATVTLEDPAARALSDNSIALEDRAVVDAAFRTLSVLERRIIVGTYVLRLSSLELGRTLGLPPRRISRIRRSALGRIQAVWVS